MPHTKERVFGMAMIMFGRGEEAHRQGFLLTDVPAYEDPEYVAAWQRGWRYEDAVTTAARRTHDQ